MKPKKLRYTTAEEIRELRKKHNLNQNEFWTRLGVTQSGGSRYESGRRVPAPVLSLLQIAYGTPTESLRVVEALRCPE